MAPTASTGPARAERVALCALLEDRGPLAPTLCEGWTTSDLAAHLYVRERRPWAGAGILVPPLAGLTRRAMDEAKRSLGYAGLISKIRSGPPGPLALLDEQMNLVEYFVHHEDVRRAGDGSAAGWREDAVLDAALWSNLRRSAWLLARHLKGVTLGLVAPGLGSVTARRPGPLVTVTGGPQELVLYLFGRKQAAHVEIEGPEEAKRAVAQARFGL